MPGSPIHIAIDNPNARNEMMRLVAEIGSLSDAKIADLVAGYSKSLLKIMRADKAEFAEMLTLIIPKLADMKTWALEGNFNTGDFKILGIDKESCSGCASGKVQEPHELDIEITEEIKNFISSKSQSMIIEDNVTGLTAELMENLMSKRELKFASLIRMIRGSHPGIDLSQYDLDMKTLTLIPVIDDPAEESAPS